jgi:hypothetical protein
MVYGSLNNPPVSAPLDHRHRWHGYMLVEKIGVQIVVLSRELHTSMSALALSELGCSLRGRNSWRIGCIKMVAPIGSLLTGSSKVHFRGTQPMASLGPMSSTMHRAAISQDAIGWRECMEGEVSKEIAAIQDAHCAASPGNLLANSHLQSSACLSRVLPCV